MELPAEGTTGFVEERLRKLLDDPVSHLSKCRDSRDPFHAKCGAA
jgi:hypothetical protein